MSYPSSVHWHGMLVVGLMPWLSVSVACTKLDHLAMLVVGSIPCRLNAMLALGTMTCRLNDVPVIGPIAWLLSVL